MFGSELPSSPWPLIFLSSAPVIPISDSSLPVHLLLSQLCKSGAYLIIYFAK